MEIFILLAGLKGHGESVRGVFTSLDKLEAVVPDVPRTYRRLNWIKTAPYRWECKDEYLEVEVMELDENIWDNIDKAYDAMVDASTTFSSTYECNGEFETAPYV